MCYKTCVYQTAAGTSGTLRLCNPIRHSHIIFFKTVYPFCKKNNQPPKSPSTHPHVNTRAVYVQCHLDTNACSPAQIRSLTFRHYSSIINWRLQNLLWTYFWLKKQRNINCLGYSGRLVNWTRMWEGNGCELPNAVSQNMSERTEGKHGHIRADTKNPEFVEFEAGAIIYRYIGHNKIFKTLL